MASLRSFVKALKNVSTGVSLFALAALGFQISMNPAAAQSLSLTGTGSPVRMPASVGLVSFTGSVKSSAVELDWQTATETNCYGFNIERLSADSLQAGTWYQIGFTQGSGTSNVAHSYVFTDPTGAVKSYAYRLKEISSDGQYAYSSTVTVTVSAPTPAPTGTFQASTTSLPSTGGSVTLTWTSTNATTASIDQGVGTEPVNGSVTVPVTATKTFTLTLANSAGVKATYSVTVTVAAPAPAPTGTFQASSTSLPSTGGSVTLTWTSTNAATASIDQGIGTEPVSGSVMVSVTATKTFTLTLTNSSGVTATYSVTVTVAPPQANTTVISAFNPAPASNNSVLLTWTTSSEHNNSRFEIQRKKNTGSFAKIATVTAVGNSTTPTNYQYLDKSLSSGTYTYRLRQINIDGTFAYSPTVSVQITRKGVTTLSSYPNPFNPSANIVFTADQSGPATLKIYNVLGQVVATLFNGDVQAGDEHEVTFNATALSTGIYFSVLESAGERVVLKLLYAK